MTNRKAGAFDQRKAEVRAAVEGYLVAAFAEHPDTEVRRVAEYITLGGGHRWRALAAVASGQMFRADALEVVLPYAAGIELVQATTLILDDLPSMDDAAIRRGRPCAHLVFPRWAVDLTPSFLVTMAYNLSLERTAATAERRVRAAVELSRAGLAMIEGQVQDMTRGKESSGSVDLIEMAALKAGAFYAASVAIGGILCGGDDRDVSDLATAGLNLGLSYQMLDDVADVVADASEIGKEPGSDGDKFTIVDLVGVDAARGKSDEYQSLGLKALQRFGPEADWLRSLVMEASWKAH